MPASVGLALSEKKTGRNRPVLCVMGDGSYQYSLKSVYAAVQQKAHVVYVVLHLAFKGTSVIVVPITKKLGNLIQK